MHFLPCHNIQCIDLKSVTRANTLKILNVQTISEYCGPLFQTVLNMAAMSACPACRWRRRCSWRWPWECPPRPGSAGSSWSHSTSAGGLSRIYLDYTEIFNKMILNVVWHLQLNINKLVQKIIRLGKLHQFHWVYRICYKQLNESIICQTGLTKILLLSIK